MRFNIHFFCAPKTYSRYTRAIRAQLRASKEKEALIEQALSLLRKQRAAVRVRTARLHNTLQPCLSLPEEILSRIFEVNYPLPGNVWPNRPSRPSPSRWSPDEYNDFLQSVGQTCTMFRSILLRSSRCRGIVMLDLLEDQCTPLVALEAQLVRSHPHLFDLFINMDLDESCAGAFQSEASILAQHMQRCRSIVTNNDGYGIAIFHALMSGASFSSLAHVSLSWTGAPDEMPDNITIQSLLPGDDHGAVPLSSLSISDSLYSYVNYSSVFLRLHSLANSLTRLRLRGPFPAPSVVPLLGHCLALEHLHWGNINTSPQTDTALLNLPCLKSLELEGLYAVAGIPSIHAPLLEQLVVKDDEEWETSPFTLFGSDQLPLLSLKRVSFRTTRPSADYCVSFLRKHTTIEELSLRIELSAEKLGRLVDVLIMPADRNRSQPAVRLTKLTLAITCDLDNSVAPALYVGLLGRLRANLVATKFFLEIEYPIPPALEGYLAANPSIKTPSKYRFIEYIWPDPWLSWEKE